MNFTSGTIHRPKTAILLAAAAASIGAPASGADAQSAEKSDYSLFNPTPDALLRPMSADRPDFTESPITVDAGRVQLEMSFLEYSRNGDFDRIDVAPINLKLGLLPNLDAQFVFTPYAREDLDQGGRAEGFDDLQLRFKLNLFGNDGGEDAFGIMPFIQFPTGDNDLSSDHVEGGLILAYARDLTDDLGLGLMAEFDSVYDDADDGYDTEFVHTAALGFPVLDRLGGYVEYIGILSFDSANDYQALFGLGLTYALRENIVLDAGTNLGLTGDADDLTLFSGITVRF